MSNPSIASPAPQSSPSTSLYRAQAIEGLRSRHGRPVALFGVRSWALVTFMFVVFIAIAVFLFTSTFARKETVEGYLQPVSGSATIILPRPGRITDIYVREGQRVTKGQRLIKVSLDTALDGETLGDRLARANDSQAAEVARQLAAAAQSGVANRDETRSRIAGVRTQAAHLAEALALQRERLTLAQETYAGLMKLRDRGFVSEMRLRDKQGEVIAMRQSIADTERQIDQARADVATLLATAGQARATNARTSARLRADRAELERERAQSDAERSVVLVAPYSGKLVTVRAVLGSAVEAGATLATVLPHDAKLEAVLWVPSRAIGFVTPGDDVRLMFDAFPFQRFGTSRGVVRAISSTPVDAKDVPFEGLAREGALYRVRVGLAAQDVWAYGRSWPLAPGSRLRADMILDRQTLVDWLLDPLQAFRKRAT